jgi:hypothetical protein
MKTDDQQGYGRDNTSPFALENTKKEFVKHKKILAFIYIMPTNFGHPSYFLAILF